MGLHRRRFEAGGERVDPSRRDFLRLAAAVGILGPAAAAVAASDDDAATKSSPLPKEYLAKGLAALSDAHRRGWLQGHHGAAILSSYYFCLENRLDERTSRALRKQIDAFIASKPEEIPDGGPGRGTADPARIVERLDRQIATLNRGGHDVIFASLALRALRDLPEYATPQVVDGIVRLLELIAASGASPETPFNRDHPLPPYGSANDIAKTTLEATLRPWGDALRIGASGVVHWITHADAVVTLADLGHEELARRGHAALRLHVNQEVTAGARPEPERAAIDWLAPAYWESDAPHRLFQNTWLAGHAFKLPYSLFRLLRRTDDAKLREACLLRASRLQIPFE